MALPASTLKLAINSRANMKTLNNNGKMIGTIESLKYILIKDLNFYLRFLFRSELKCFSLNFDIF
jgi:hypothetical protein